MLFDLWQQTARRLRDHDALVDIVSGQRITFGALDRMAAALPPVRPCEIVLATTAHGPADFMAQTIRAWRHNAILCPYEAQPPNTTLLQGLPDGIAHVKSTSGSTGRARFVLFREEQLLADVTNISVTMGFDPRHPNLGVISMAHSYGFSHLVLPLLLLGMPLWHVSHPLPGSMRVAFASGKTFFLPAVPAMWRAWQQAGVLNQAPILLAMSAGAPLPLELETAVFEQSGIKIHNFYGASECGGIAYDATTTPRTDATLVGTSLRGVTLGTNADGCMVITSKAVGTGYWPPEADSPVSDGTFTASDLAEIAPDGVRLIGRASDTINVAGRKISPSEIECALLTCPRVLHCVVFGVPSIDASRGEDIVACVSGDAALRPPDLLSFLSTRLAAWQLPRRWWIHCDVEPDERGKISRNHWRARFLEQAETTVRG